MPLTANLEGEIVIATKDLQRQAPYYCRWCEEKMHIAQGTVVKPYFAHYPKPGKERECLGLHKPESEQHRQMKNALYSMLKDAKLEHRVDQNIFDVYTPNGHVYECQYSAISHKEYEKRCRTATNNNLQLHWILGVGEYTDEEDKAFRHRDIFVHNKTGYFYGKTYHSVISGATVADPTWFERLLAGIGHFTKVRPLFYYDVEQDKFFKRLLTRPEKDRRGPWLFQQWEIRPRELETDMPPPARRVIAINPNTKKYELLEYGRFGEIIVLRELTRAEDWWTVNPMA